MISTIPAKIPSRSQNGTPIAQNASDSTVPTNAISTSWPRTNAPSFASIRSQVSRTVFLWSCASSDKSTRLARSRSKIQ
jgi:hypothetical protein